ncbi:MAG: helix-turn-helix transcriptional regulator, partial [Saprospiraceae bacterium]
EIAVTSADEKFLAQLVQFIEIKMDNAQLTIEALAAAAHLSPSQLHRKTKALTGQSPSVFLRTIRLQRAHQLLEQQAGNVSEISVMTGFVNLSYFTRVFRQHFGYAPSSILTEKT